MKRVSMLFFIIITALSAYCQTYIQEGDRCFDGGDYACAITNYNNAFRNATGRDQQITEIKLTRAKWCAEYLKSADQEFAAKNYFIAKQDYQKVFDSNPNDSYAKSQIAKCVEALNPPRLREATTAELTDIWNNKYGIHPQRRQNLINAGIDPDDAQNRINAGEGKPLEKEKLATNLSVSKSTLFFPSNGGTSELIRVNTDASTYFVPWVLVPLWCTTKVSGGYFTVTASPNPDYTSRKDWFKVTAGDQEVIINVEQAARPGHPSEQSSDPQNQLTQGNEKKCFNCPKTRNTWGLTLGYTQQTIDHYPMDVIQFGLKVEPLFRYGFGLNTGINLLGYSKNLYDNILYESGFDSYAVNIPLHLEYRLNFSKWFNIFAYGGVGFNAITNSNFDDYTLPATFEYGSGLRINRVQFNVGQSLYIGNLSDIQNFGKHTETYQKFILSVSFMF